MVDTALTPSDFAPWGVTDDNGKLSELIRDVMAQAVIVAPCLSDPSFPYRDAARATLREAVLRRLDAGTGTITTKQQGTGPFTSTETIDNRQKRGILSPSDITDLQRLCLTFKGGRTTRAGSVNLDPHPGGDPLDLASRPDLWFQINSPYPVLGLDGR